MDAASFRNKWTEAKWVAREVCWRGTDRTFPPGCVWAPVAFGEVRGAWAKAASRVLPLADLGLYVHVPFCLSKCTYCSMYSVVRTRPSDWATYLDCLEKEISLLGLPRGLKPSSLYLGGGTPSILEPRQLRRLLELLHARFDLSACREKMAELSPRTATLEKLRLLRAYGFDSVTIGVQTNDPCLLKKINRIQDDAGVERLYHNARRAGISYINIDLMAGIPGQTLRSFLRSVDFALSLAPDTVHLNQFRPNEIPLICRGGAGSGAAEIALRTEMVRLGAERIAAVRPSAAENASGPGGEEHLHYPKYSNSSVFGLGYGAMSHVSREVHYESAGGYEAYVRDLAAGRFPALTGCLMSLRREMREYVVQNLENDGQVPLDWFRKLFGRSFLSEFRAEAGALEAAGLALRDGGAWRLRSDRRLYRCALAKFFYEKSVWGKVLAMSRRRPLLTAGLDQELLYLLGAD